MNPVLLGVFAHPDDETFLAGPLLARCAAQGVRVEVACATPPEPTSQSPQDWDYRHRQALLCAARALGVSQVHFLGYEGTPTTSGAAYHLDQVAALPRQELAEAIGMVVTCVAPDVVLTDSPYGAYGHPDHVAVHQATMAAFHDHGKGGARLYCLAFPLPLVRLNLRLMSLRGIDSRHFGPRGDIDLAAIVASAREKTALVPVGRYVSYRRAAARCYAEDIALAPLPLKLLEKAPLIVQRLLFWRCALTRLSPSPELGEPLEREVFP
ncbi:MAG: PIG-L family deacetylase [Chloroflexi bacterium]|nr:PIG-L family deacetylase [Chloroflexota bacterium]